MKQLEILKKKIDETVDWENGSATPPVDPAVKKRNSDAVAQPRIEAIRNASAVLDPYIKSGLSILSQHNIKYSLRRIYPDYGYSGTVSNLTMGYYYFGEENKRDPRYHNRDLILDDIIGINGIAVGVSCTFKKSPPHPTNAPFPGFDPTPVSLDNVILKCRMLTHEDNQRPEIPPEVINAIKEKFLNAELLARWTPRWTNAG